jgi:nicotinate-nucleotide adenylyltransferase
VASSAAPALRVAVFGGSFNPPHVAHLFAAVYALACAPIDRVLVVPVYRHPFAKELASYDDRLAMCRLAFGQVPGVEISTVERELDGESLTLRTVEHLAATKPEWTLRLLVGADVLTDLPKWHRFDRISEIAPPLVLGRKGFGSSAPGLSAGPQLLPEISSTEVRKAIGEGRSADVAADLPRTVLDYIESRRLYGAKRG